MDLKKLQLAIEFELEGIEKILGPHYKLTLIAEHDGNEGLKDADIVLTMSERAAIDTVLDRRLPK